MLGRKPTADFRAFPWQRANSGSAVVGTHFLFLSCSSHHIGVIQKNIYNPQVCFEALHELLRAQTQMYKVSWILRLSFCGLQAISVSPIGMDENMLLEQEAMPTASLHGAAETQPL